MSNSRLKIFIATLAIAISSSAQSSPSTLDDDYFERPYYLLVAEAENASADGRWTEARDRLLDAIAIEPNNPGNILLMANLGLIYSQTGSDSLAIATLDRAIEQAPSMSILYNNRGRVRLKLGLDTMARTDFDTAISLDSLCTSARYYRGLIALYGGDFSTAEADFDVLAAQRPDDTNTAIALSTLYSMSANPDKAVPYFKRLIADDPAAEYYASLAGCYLAIGDLTEASATIADGMRRYPTDPELYFYRAWLNRDRLLPSDARADGRRAVELGIPARRVKALLEAPAGSGMGLIQR